MRGVDCSHFCLDNLRERLTRQQESCKGNTNLVSLFEIVILNIFYSSLFKIKESLSKLLILKNDF